MLDVALVRNSLGVIVLVVVAMGDFPGIFLVVVAIQHRG